MKKEEKKDEMSSSHVIARQAPFLGNPNDDSATHQISHKYLLLSFFLSVKDDCWGKSSKLGNRPHTDETSLLFLQGAV